MLEFSYPSTHHHNATQVKRASQAALQPCSYINTAAELDRSHQVRAQCAYTCMFRAISSRTLQNPRTTHIVPVAYRRSRTLTRTRHDEDKRKEYPYRRQARTGHCGLPQRARGHTTRPSPGRHLSLWQIMNKLGPGVCFRARLGMVARAAAAIVNSI